MITSIVTGTFLYIWAGLMMLDHHAADFEQLKRKDDRDIEVKRRAACRIEATGQACDYDAEQDAKNAEDARAWLRLVVVVAWPVFFVMGIGK